ncbi:MAG: hypothetical protein ORN85_04330 [Sediminibacterium sp.]|nr:hypothetical protein [Sediminibacterium sp.]
MIFSHTDIDIWAQTTQTNQQINAVDLKQICYFNDNIIGGQVESKLNILISAIVVLEDECFKELVWKDENFEIRKSSDYVISTQDIYFQGLEMLQKNCMPFIPLIDDQNKYLGCISITKMMQLINPLNQSDQYNCIAVKFYYKAPCLNHFLNIALVEGVKLINVQFFSSTIDADCHYIFCQYSNTDPLYFRRKLENEKYEIIYQNFNNQESAESDYNFQHLLNFLSLDATAK